MRDGIVLRFPFPLRCARTGAFWAFLLLAAFRFSLVSRFARRLFRSPPSPSPLTFPLDSPLALVLVLVVFVAVVDMTARPPSLFNEPIHA